MNNSIKLPRRNTKIFSIINHFATGKTLHRFQAERIGDHTLNSSISGITRAYGLIFNSEWIEVPTNFGGTVRVKKYWLENGQLEKAQRLTKARVICFDTPQKVRNFLTNHPELA